MKKRVFVGGFHHESDTFNPIVTGENDIWVRRGKELFIPEREDALSGIISTFEKQGYEIIPSLIARAVPNGEWDKHYYLSLKKEFLDILASSLPLDGICLALHGSMRVKDIGEAEGDLLEDVRAICPDIPLVTSLDMHATLTKRMLSLSNAFVGYKFAPHTDAFETGESAARILISMLESGAIPTMEAYHIPMLIAGEKSETSTEPMKSIMDFVRDYEKKDGVISASLLLGFPWADVEENGVSALVVTNSNREKARKYAEEIANLFWSKRREFSFYGDSYEEDECLDKTRELVQKKEFPIIISDSGDNPTAGSSGDVTNFLSLILNDIELSSLNPPLVYQAIYDPEIVEIAFSKGIGGIVQGALGSKFDMKTSKPIAINAKVLALKERWEKAQDVNLALLDIFGVNVVVTSKHVGCYDPDMLRVLGVEPEICKVIVVKLGYLEPELKRIAKHSLMALTDGCTNENFEYLEYNKLKRPIFPLDDDKNIGPELINY